METTTCLNLPSNSLIQEASCECALTHRCLLNRTAHDSFRNFFRRHFFRVLTLKKLYKDKEKYNTFTLMKKNQENDIYLNSD